MLRRIQRRAFTLIEIIVVATLISLLSGIALFSINEMYISNIRKVSFAEAFQLATALSIAENDLGFYPSFNYLRQPKELVLLEETASNAFSQSNTPDSMIPEIDYWGIYRHNSPAVLKVIANWKGPYMGVSQARQNSNRSAQSGLVKMRLPYLAQLLVDGSTIPIPSSVVDWPADSFGNPYMLYQFRANIDDTFNGNIPLFLEDPTQDGSWRNMIVSYGRNNVPGGNDRTATGFAQNTLLPGALYIEGDPYSDSVLADGPADFTLKIMDKRTIASQPGLSAADIAADNATMAAIEAESSNLLLSNDPTAVATSDTTSQHYLILRSLALEAMDAGSFDASNGQVGVIDGGSDDIVLEF